MFDEDNSNLTILSNSFAIFSTSYPDEDNSNLTILSNGMVYPSSSIEMKIIQI